MRALQVVGYVKEMQELQGLAKRMVVLHLQKERECVCVVLSAPLRLSAWAWTRGGGLAYRVDGGTCAGCCACCCACIM